MGLCKYLTINDRLNRFLATEYEYCQGHVTHGTRVSDILPSVARGREARVTPVTLPIMWINSWSVKRYLQNVTHLKLSAALSSGLWRQSDS